METKNVVLNGVTNEPNDYKHQDGDLSLCVNAVKHNGSIRTIGNGEVVSGVTINSGEKLIYIHNVNGTDHYIFCKETADATDPTGVSSSGNKYTIKSPVNQVTSVGNTLVVTGYNNKLGYYIWKDSTYKYIGSSIPDLPVNFMLKGIVNQMIDVGYVTVNTSEIDLNELEYRERLTGNCTTNTQFTVTLSEDYSNAGVVRIFNYSGWIAVVNGIEIESGKYSDFKYLKSQPFGGELSIKLNAHRDDTPTVSTTYSFEIFSIDSEYTSQIDNTQENVDSVIGSVNKFVNRANDTNGRFVYPFFVRCALELYDGSYVNHSPLCLMVPLKGQSPIILANGLRGTGKFDIDVFGVECDLYYSADLSKLNEIKSKWNDIVRGISIAVSSPIIVNKLSERFVKGSPYFKYNIVYLKSGDSRYGIKGLHSYANIKSEGYKDNDLSSYFYDCPIPSGSYYSISLPEYSTAEIEEKIRDISGVYKLCDISLNEISTSETKVDTKNKKLSSIETYPTLNDDYNTHNVVSPSVLYTYNNRLNISDITEKFWKGFPVNECNGLAYTSNGNSSSFSHKCVVRLVKDGEESYVMSSSGNGLNHILYFFYPSSYAKSAIIYYKDSSSSKYYKREINIIECTNINGAYWFNNFETIEWEDSSENEYNKYNNAETIFTYNNKIYTSEVGNPFLFKAEMRNVVGNTKIIGLSTTTKALSQGQFGQFPLYCFTNDGIWALETKDDGGWKSVQPVSRDVCISPSSITQTDGSVLFVTKRGLMELSGDKTTLISETLDGHNYLSDLVKLDNAFSVAHINDIDSTDLDTHITDFLYGSSIIYDYKHQLLYIFKDGYKLGYVYDYGSKSWGMYINELKYPVNSYEKSLAVRHTNIIRDPSEINFSSCDVINGMRVKASTEYKSLIVEQDGNATIYEIPYTGNDNSKLTISANGSKKATVLFLSKRLTDLGIDAGDTSYYAGKGFDDSVVVTATASSSQSVVIPAGTNYIYIVKNDYTGANCTPYSATIIGLLQNALVDMSENESNFETKTHNILLITRPLVFDYDDIHKTIESMIVRGNFISGDIGLVIWASNNLRDWVVIGSSNNEKWRNYSGTPYKYFRVGVLGSMQERDSINSISVQFTPRLTNKIR